MANDYQIGKNGGKEKTTIGKRLSGVRKIERESERKEEEIRRYVRKWLELLKMPTGIK